jgi:hypothetical protein
MRGESGSAHSKKRKFSRDGSPVNRTEAALMGRGIDRATAARLRGEGWTLGKLKAASEAKLKKLGLNDRFITALRMEQRSEIPFESLVQVLIANRFTCCVCHDPTKSIIVHHIQEWSVSHDHSPKNLAALCLDHHDKAHSKSELSRNLDARALRQFNGAWEAEVARLNTTAILDASRAKSDAWIYFNHLRLFELAASFRIRLDRLDRYPAPSTADLLNSDGTLRARPKSLDYMYEGGEGVSLYLYTREVMHAVLEHVTVLNISDYLDRGLLLPVVKPGDFIFVQGAHNFRRIDKKSTGSHQTSEGKRRANHVEVAFTFDRWEATSSSAHGLWLRGRQSVASLVRIARVEHSADKLHLTGTVIGIALAFESLKLRDYTPHGRVRRPKRRRTISI